MGLGEPRSRAALDRGGEEGPVARGQPIRVERSGATFGPNLGLRQFEDFGDTLAQHGAEREAVNGFAVERRCQRIRADVQTSTHGSLGSGQFYALGTAFCEHGAELQAGRVSL